MNDKTNLTGHTAGLTLNTPSTLTTNSSGTVSTNITDNWGTPISAGSNIVIGNGTNYNSISTSITNSITNTNNMNRQVQVAVFTVERNEDNKVTSSKFVKEIWVEVKNGASLELSVAKHLDKDFDPSTTIIRELFSFTF